MPKLEDVIKGLECCTSEAGCFECPVGFGYGCAIKLKKDAIALLKEREARVFDVGDFFGEEFGYLEYRTDKPGFSNFEPNPVLISDIDEENVTVIFRSASVLKLPLDKMKKNWRIWSDYPTHELLKAGKWNDSER